MESKPVIKGNIRTYRVWLDTNQYQKDMERIIKDDEVIIIYLLFFNLLKDVYETFNIFIRRKAKENNFKVFTDTNQIVLSLD